MTSLDKYGQLRLRQAGYKKAKDLAMSFISQAFEQCQLPILSHSGGKDGGAMLAMVNQTALELERDFVIWAHVSTASFPGTIETLQAHADITKRELILDQSPVDAFEVIKDSVKNYGKSGYFFEAIRRFQQSYGYDLTFVGTRAEESKRRQEAARAHGHLYTSHVTGMQRVICTPLVWATVDDVCAMNVEAGLPFHPIYSKYHPSGDSRKIRLGYMTAQDDHIVAWGGVAFLRQNYPDYYRLLVAASPKFAGYT